MKGLLFLMFVVFISCIMFSSQTLYQSHLDENKTFNIYNFTENNLVWNYTNSKNDIRNNFSHFTKLDYDKIQSKRITNLIHKAVDWLGYSIFELSKWAMEFGYNHPEYDFGFFTNFVLYYLYAMIAIAIFPIIIPLVALIYLTFIGIKKIYQWIRKKAKKCH